MNVCKVSAIVLVVYALDAYRSTDVLLELNILSLELGLTSFDFPNLLVLWKPLLH